MDNPLRTRSLALRVAARYHMAMEFDTPKALKDYLKEHPKADPHNHTVKKPGHGSGHEEEHKEFSWKDVFKSLSKGAKAVVEKGPTEVKKFLHDDSYRRTTLMGAHKALLAAPGKYVDNAYKHAKHTVKEFKDAGIGIQNLVTGKEVTKQQKSAMKEVAKHCAISVAIGALGVGFGAGVGAAALGKGVAHEFVRSLAEKIAVRAVSVPMDKFTEAKEIAHLTHHGFELVKTLMERIASEDKKEATPDEIFKAFIVAAVAKELKGLSPDTVKEALESAV